MIESRRQFLVSAVAGTAAATQNVLPAQGARPLEAGGIAIDRTGSQDVTSALQAWLNACMRNGDVAFLPPGSYRTSGELTLGGFKAPVHLFGIPGQSVILPQGNSYNGLRIAAVPLSHTKTGIISGIAIRSTGALAKNGKAAFLCDASPYFVLQDCEASGFDVGFDFINNNYNASMFRCSVPRFNSCNVGIYLRRGSQSGSDMSFFDTNIHAARSAIVIEGGGGGYLFDGGQLGASPNEGADVPNDKEGCIMLGWDYADERPYDGLVTTKFSRIGLEGWQNTWGVRAFGYNDVVFDGLAFNASKKGPGMALGIFKGTDLKNSVFVFRDCQAVGSYASAAILSQQNSYGINNIVEEGWKIAAAGNQITAKGASYRDLSPGICFLSGFNAIRNVGHDGTQAMQGLHLRNNAGVLEKSLDRSTWTPV